MCDGGVEVEEGDSYMKLPTIQGLALPPPPAKSEAMQEVCMHVRTHMHLHSHTDTHTLSALQCNC